MDIYLPAIPSANVCSTLLNLTVAMHGLQFLLEPLAQLALNCLAHVVCVSRVSSALCLPSFHLCFIIKAKYDAWKFGKMAFNATSCGNDSFLFNCHSLGFRVIV